jgi:GNAT superfamily N-acetyltransferase
MNFVIFALPRSRTAWLSRFLAYGDWQCGHDELRHCRSLADVASWFAQPNTGTVETAAAPFWRLVPEGVRVATIRRPIEDVAASLARTGVEVDARVCRHLLYLNRKLDQIERRVNCVRWSYDALADPEYCAGLFTYCTGLTLDPGWYDYMAPANIQASVPHMVRYARAHGPQIEKLRQIAKHEMLRRLPRRVGLVGEIPGVTFQQETLAQAFNDPDGQRLMSDECVLLGEAPEAYRQMNIPLLARIEAIGNLHIMTARSNGRMFGYSVMACGEAFHSLTDTEADQVSFYADPSWPGLGRKLQQAAIEDLRAKGITRVLMFQPDETRVGAVYRRLGAKQTGQRFVLELQ